MLRMRMVHPGFWKDSRLSRLDDGDRLLFIGLWMLADDAGWFHNNPEEQAAELFPYRNPGSRIRYMESGLRSLASAELVKFYPCGHGHIPKLAIYQKAGHPIYRYRDQHLTVCTEEVDQNLPDSAGLPAIAADSAGFRPARVGMGGSGKVSKNLALVREDRRGGATGPTSLKAIIGDFSDIVKPRVLPIPKEAGS